MAGDTLMLLWLIGKGFKAREIVFLQVGGADPEDGFGTDVEDGFDADFDGNPSADLG